MWRPQVRLPRPRAAFLGALAQTPPTPGRAAKSGPASAYAFAKEVGDLEARYDRAAWQSSELILQGLRSDNDEARLKAFHLLGATDDDAHETEYAPNGEATLVATPWKSALLYAPLGEDSTEQAIVAVQVRNLVLVAVESGEPSGDPSRRRAVLRWFRKSWGPACISTIPGFWRSR